MSMDELVLYLGGGQERVQKARRRRSRVRRSRSRRRALDQEGACPAPSRGSDGVAVVVDFTAVGGAPCQKIAPFFAKLASPPPRTHSARRWTSAIARRMKS